MEAITGKMNDNSEPPSSRVAPLCLIPGCAKRPL